MTRRQPQKEAVNDYPRGLDNEISEAGFEGRALGGESRAKNDIKQMVRMLLEES